MGDGNRAAAAAAARYLDARIRVNSTLRVGLVGKSYSAVRGRTDRNIVNMSVCVCVG